MSSVPPLTTAEARRVFAAFAPALQAAMKAAARVDQWTAADWPWDVAHCAERIERSGYDPAEVAALTAAYRILAPNDPPAPPRKPGKPIGYAYLDRDLAIYPR